MSEDEDDRPKVVMFPGAFKRSEPADDNQVLPAGMPRMLVKDLFGTMIENGVVATIVDVRECDVPATSRAKNIEGFNWSLQFHVADFDFDDVGVRGSLQFGSKDDTYKVDIPWPAVRMMTCVAASQTAVCVRGLVTQLHGPGSLDFFDISDLSSDAARLH